MDESFTDPVADVVRKTVARSLLAFAGVQGAVITGLVVLDLIKKRGRSKRKGFPHPGIFDRTIADTDVTTYTYGADLYRDMLQAIREAKDSILLETFIWKNDETGQELHQRSGRPGRGRLCHLRWIRELGCAILVFPVPPGRARPPFSRDPYLYAR